MKYLITIIALIFLVSCHEAGEIRQPQINEIIINGKSYSVHKIYLDDISHPITILVPDDSTGLVPLSVNQTQKSGKTTYNSSTIVIK